MFIVIVTGLSGAGKSTALCALEDSQFFCVDNMPLPLVHELVRVAEAGGIDHVAISVDARQHMYLHSFAAMVTKLRADGHRVEVLFLEAQDSVLLRRYSETRRRHPLSGDDLSEGIHRDRETLSSLRDDSTVIDTGSLNVHRLRALVHRRFAKAGDGMAVTLQSFGYKYGLPPDSDLVFDVRFLPNPYFVADLRELDGREKNVSDYVLTTEMGDELVNHVERFLRYALPNFAGEGKLYLTVGIGCTGGRHRSVAIVEELQRRLSSDWDLVVRHRDINRKSQGK